MDSIHFLAFHNDFFFQQHLFRSTGFLRILQERGTVSKRILSRFLCDCWRFRAYFSVSLPCSRDLFDFLDLSGAGFIRILYDLLSRSSGDVFKFTTLKDSSLKSNFIGLSIDSFAQIL